MALGAEVISPVEPQGTQSGLSSNGGTVASERSAAGDAGIALKKAPQLHSYQNRIFVAGFALLNILLFEYLMVQPSYSALAPTLRTVFAPVVAILALISVFFCCLPTLSSALSTLKAGALSSEVNLSLALLISCGFTVNAVIFEQGLLATLPIFAGTVALCFAVLLKEPVDRWIKNSLVKRSQFGLSTLVSRVRLVGDKPQSPLPADKNSFDSEVWIAVQSARPGDSFKVLPGEFIPCDGVVTSGSAEVAERKLSAHETIRVKALGDEVFAGSRVLQGEISCKVTTLFEDSFASSMEKYLQQSLKPGSSERENIERFEWHANILILAAAFLIGEFLYISGQSSAQAVMVAIAILVIGVIPETVARSLYARQSSLIKAFGQGVLVRGLHLLTKLRQIRTVLFDFSLSHSDSVFESSAEVKSIELLDQRVDRDGLVSAIYSLLTHFDAELLLQIAKFCRHSLGRNISLHKVKEPHYYPGLGVCGVVEGANLSLGSEEFLIERGVQIEPGEVLGNSAESTYLYLAIEAEVIARILVSPQKSLAPRSMISELRHRNLRVLLSGREEPSIMDREGKAMGLDLTEIHSQMADEDLHSKVKLLNPVALVTSKLTPDDVVKAAHISVGLFDEYRWEPERTDIVIFGQGVVGFNHALDLAYRGRNSEVLALIIAGVSAVALLIAAAFGFLSPVETLALSTICSILTFGIQKVGS